jgi:tRNA nucleotidyltransferase (CCA-adding enzyme)
METYLVGGAVRDALLGLPVDERDWVVVGATPEEMLRLGFQPVGKDFPVFLHPETHEEYALARTERKIGKGYKGFTFYSAPDVSLIADLQRRDLTINAIAQTSDGRLIDPYGGQADLTHRILRHVSPAFQEDPVRILRIARFAARFTEFSIHPDTLALMQHMVNNGEVNALVAERVWQEFARALAAKNPLRFLTVLASCGALAVLFPEIQLTDAVQQAVNNAIQSSPAATVRFAALLHPLEENAVRALCQRYRIPREYTDLAILTACWHREYQCINQATAPQMIFHLLKATDARRRPERFQQFLTACEACSGTSQASTEQFLKTCAQKMQIIDTKPLQEQGLRGDEFSSALEKLQLKMIQIELQNLSLK